MKVKNGFIVHDVADSHVVIAVGDRVKEFNGIIRLNETGLFLWNHLGKDTDIGKLKEALTEEYEVSDSEAEKDIQMFLDTLKNAGVLENF